MNHPSCAIRSGRLQSDVTVEIVFDRSKVLRAITAAKFLSRNYQESKEIFVV
jgi:hypothetical protein